MLVTNYAIDGASVESREYTRDGLQEKKSLLQATKNSLAIKRERVAKSIEDEALRELVQFAPLSWFKAAEYRECIAERILSLAYVHAYYYEKALDHSYKSIIWTIRHTRALSSRKNMTFTDALNFVEDKENTRYSAHNLDTLIQSLNIDIQVKRENDFIGLSGEQFRQRRVFERGLAMRRYELTENMVMKEEGLNPENVAEAESNARHYVAMILASLRVDVKERIHAIARIVRRCDRARGLKYLARADINLFFNRVYNKATIEMTLAGDTTSLTQADFVYLIIKYCH